MAAKTNFPRETTLKRIAVALEGINSNLAIQSGVYSPELLDSYDSILSVVASGKASEVFRAGDQIIVPYTWSGTEYQWAWDIAHFADVELEDGSIVPGMYLQAHHTTIPTIPFDPINAFYYAEEGLPAGTYYFTIDASWGTGWKSGEILQFTLTDSVPAGAQLVLATNLYSNAADGAKINIYSGPDSTTVLQTSVVSVVESGDGTSLGTIGTGFNGNMCSLYPATGGYDRWAKCAYRQWLNSSAEAGSWWTPSLVFSRPASAMTSYPGFMSGFSSDFLNIIKPVKVATSLDTTEHPDGVSGTEYTFDRFFLTSLEQQFIKPTVSGVEGDAFEYWQKISGGTQYARSSSSGTYPEFYKMDATSTAANIRLRSSNRNDSCLSYRIDTSGGINFNVSSTAYRCVPACVVCAA